MLPQWRGWPDVIGPQQFEFDDLLWLVRHAHDFHTARVLGHDVPRLSRPGQRIVAFLGEDTPQCCLASAARLLGCSVVWIAEGAYRKRDTVCGPIIDTRTGIISALAQIVRIMGGHHDDTVRVYISGDFTSPAMAAFFQFLAMYSGIRRIFVFIPLSQHLQITDRFQRYVIEERIAIQGVPDTAVTEQGAVPIDIPAVIAALLDLIFLRMDALARSA